MKRKVGLVLGLALLSSTALAAGTISNGAKHHGSIASTYSVTPLVSNQVGAAPVLDRRLVNPWGISDVAGAPLWVSDEGSSQATTYDPANGTKEPTRVRIPGGGPTGIMAIPPNPDGSGDFQITQHGQTNRAFFIFATTSGRIEGWNPNVNPDAAITVLDRSGVGSVFTGLGFRGSSRTLLAADFANGFVDEFDGNFDQIGHFTDNTLPEGYSPFNVRVMKGKIYVAFALSDGEGEEEVGPGLGAIDIFDGAGNRVTQLVAPGGVLNAPWGMTIAPSNFGDFSGALLVGNFGDGTIHAFNPDTGEHLGTLNDNTGTPIALPGLWGIMAGPGGDVTFASGPDDEQNGLVGRITLNGSGG